MDEFGLKIYPGLSLASIERLAIDQTLKFTRGNKTRAAHILGISTRALRYKTNGR